MNHLAHKGFSILLTSGDLLHQSSLKQSGGSGLKLVKARKLWLAINTLELSYNANCYNLMRSKVTIEKD